MIAKHPYDLRRLRVAAITFAAAVFWVWCPTLADPVPKLTILSFMDDVKTVQTRLGTVTFAQGENVVLNGQPIKFDGLFGVVGMDAIPNTHGAQYIIITTNDNKYDCHPRNRYFILDFTAREQPDVAEIYSDCHETISKYASTPERDLAVTLAFEGVSLDHSVAIYHEGVITRYDLPTRPQANAKWRAIVDENHARREKYEIFHKLDDDGTVQTIRGPLTLRQKPNSTILKIQHRSFKIETAGDTDFYQFPAQGPAQVVIARAFRGGEFCPDPNHYIIFDLRRAGPIVASEPIEPCDFGPPNIRLNADAVTLQFWNDWSYKGKGSIFKYSNGKVKMIDD